MRERDIRDYFVLSSQTPFLLSWNTSKLTTRKKGRESSMRESSSERAQVRKAKELK
jgi:hypothetical protein